MKTRVAILAALITVLASACNNKTWIECQPATTIRTKNRALTSPIMTPDQGQQEAATC
jgi:hypothetical protein